jgi:transposase
VGGCGAAPTQEPAGRETGRRPASDLGHFHVLKSGCRWVDCPADYGPAKTVYNRFNRWSARGFWLKLLEALVDAGAVTRSTAIDSTYVKAQRSAFGGKKGLKRRRSAARAVAGRPRSTRSPTSSAAPTR